jgi:hypothetical protein
VSGVYLMCTKFREIQSVSDMKCTVAGGGGVPSSFRPLRESLSLSRIQFSKRSVHLM